MKCIIAVFMSVVCCVATQVLAQPKQREFITAEVNIKKEKFFREIKVPLSEKPFFKDTKAFNEGEFFAEGLVITHCTNCKLSRDYTIIAYVMPSSVDLSTLNISVSFRYQKECDVKGKEILVKRGEESEIKLKCGISVNSLLLTEENLIRQIISAVLFSSKLRFMKK